jgi:hypothetical protein
VIIALIQSVVQAIAFIHERLVAHRVCHLSRDISSPHVDTGFKQDVFLDNFLLEWHPESLRVTGVRGSARPRVFMIDFETAINFDANVDRRLCLTKGWPFPKDVYKRPLAPELESGESYCPFKLDIWQFAHGFRNFRASSISPC